MKKVANREGTGVNLGLIITPMLDMSFQILAFFIMTYHPSALEGHLAGSLAPPEASPAGNPAVQAPLDPVVSLDDLADVPLVLVKVGAPAAGPPGRVFIKDRTDPAPRQVADATIAWDEARRELGRQLRPLRVAAGDGRADVKIAADADLRQEYVLQVYDVCKQAGFARISFVPPPREALANR